MANKPESVFITVRGKLNYAKILGNPVPNYEGDGKEWKLDILPLDEAKVRAAFKREGVSERIKQKEEYMDGAPYISLRQREMTKAGAKNESPRVEDVTGAIWPQDKLLGNGTIADVKIRIADYGKGLKKGMYISGVRILEHVPYVRPLFDELDEDDPYYQKANAAKLNSDADEEQVDDASQGDQAGEEDHSGNPDDDLSDDVPF